MAKSKAKGPKAIKEAILAADGPEQPVTPSKEQLAEADLRAVAIDLFGEEPRGLVFVGATNDGKWQMIGVGDGLLRNYLVDVAKSAIMEGK